MPIPLQSSVGRSNHHRIDFFFFFVHNGLRETALSRGKTQFAHGKGFVVPFSSWRTANPARQQFARQRGFPMCSLSHARQSLFAMWFSGARKNKSMKKTMFNIFCPVLFRCTWQTKQRNLKEGIRPLPAPCWAPARRRRHTAPPRPCRCYKGCRRATAFGKKGRWREMLERETERNAEREPRVRGGEGEEAHCRIWLLRHRCQEPRAQALIRHGEDCRWQH